MTRILVIDDDGHIRLGLQYLLESWGYEVHLAKNAREALDCLRHYSCELAMVDLLLPNEFGEESYEEGIKILIQMSELYPTLPAIVLTALGDDQEVMNACQQISNCKAYLGKEPNPDKVKKAVEEVLPPKRIGHLKEDLHER